MGNPILKWTQGDPFTLEPWPVNEDFFHLIKDHRTNHISSSVLHLIRKKLISLLKVLMDKIVSPPKLWDSDHGIFIVTPISSHLLVVFLRLNILQLGTSITAKWRKWRWSRIKDHRTDQTSSSQSWKFWWTRSWEEWKYQKCKQINLSKLTV